MAEPKTKPSPTSNIPLTSAEAFAAIAVIAVAADGYIMASESQMITSTLSRMQLFSEYSADEKRKMIDRLLELLQQEGREKLLSAAVGKLPNELKETAFAIATDITLADGDLAEEEESLLNDLYNALKISENMASTIIDVMLIKNRG